MVSMIQDHRLGRSDQSLAPEVLHVYVGEVNERMNCRVSFPQYFLCRHLCKRARSIQSEGTLSVAISPLGPGYVGADASTLVLGSANLESAVEAWRFYHDMPFELPNCDNPTAYQWYIDNNCDRPVATHSSLLRDGACSRADGFVH